MNFSEEWRFLWETSCSSQAPQVIQNSKESSRLGPLLFNPLPSTVTPLISSQYLIPPSLPPTPRLSVQRFLQTSSAAVSSSFFADESLPSPADNFAQNHLEPLPCPDARSTLAFFPTGENNDRVGFVLLKVIDSQLCVEGNVFLSPESFGHRILQLAASPAAALFDDDDDDDCVGYLMASTMYCVHWFTVRLVASQSESDLKKPVLVYMGNKLFKSSAVVRVCWSPHLPEESLVLLESGVLFLFDVNDSRFTGQRLKVSWDESPKGEWLSCEFSWHPEIVVVANSDAVFLVDFSLDEYSHVTCLLTLELLGPTDAVETERFVSFSKVGSDAFSFVVASECRLVLLDTRKPCQPVLRWLHTHCYPHYINVFPLSELRGSLGSAEFNKASEKGFAIVLGSFWTGEFSVFCYGPSLASLKRTVSFDKPIIVSDPFYAWDLPSDLSLSGRDCPCSTCLIRQVLAKDDLPDRVYWQQKKELVVGFFILDKDVSSLIPNPDDDADAGFVIIRSMSSGKLESQRYRACWGFPTKLEPAHQESPLDDNNFYLCCMDDDEYSSPRMFTYLRLENLNAHLKGSLTEVLFSKFKRLSESVGKSKRSKKSKMHGLTEPATVSDAVKDIGTPTSIYEVAFRRLWTRLPKDLSEMVFPPSKEPSKKVSKKMQPSIDLVGPVVPLAVSIVFKQIRENGLSNSEKVNQFSPGTEIMLESMHVLKSLSTDDEETRDGSNKNEKLTLFSPFSFRDGVQKDADLDDRARCTTTLIAKLGTEEHGGDTSSEASKLFDDLCPYQLKYDDLSEGIAGTKEMQLYSVVKEQLKTLQHDFRPYADFCAQFEELIPK